ncbi:hypothetical protein R9C00_13165 [Flammeovirgaceae bacterium SG7u.111]|nr:hypothetical protein [Flammeovirgaceae bacterium SG7u.132]WPO38406.1 hypothetical protein R9C00_13165 [Flammeovirgaceae bacterium SG7u.111]
MTVVTDELLQSLREIGFAVDQIGYTSFVAHISKDWGTFYALNCVSGVCDLIYYSGSRKEVLVKGLHVSNAQETLLLLLSSQKFAADFPEAREDLKEVLAGLLQSN